MLKVLFANNCSVHEALLLLWLSEIRSNSGIFNVDGASYDVDEEESAFIFDEAKYGL